MDRKIKIYLYLYLHKFFKLLNKHIYFDNGYGIKVFNKQQFNILRNNFQVCNIDYKNLYLGFDGLKDKYTLINTKISQSPHYNFMKYIDIDCNNIDSCDYIRREYFGYLDGRFEQNVNKKNLNLHIEYFKKNKKKIENNDYKPILVYMLDNKYYIIDGKHRAAVCALLNKSVKCIIVDVNELKKDIYTNELLHKMLDCKNKYLYTKNIEHIKNLLS